MVRRRGGSCERCDRFGTLGRAGRTPGANGSLPDLASWTSDPTVPWTGARAVAQLRAAHRSRNRPSHSKTASGPRASWPSFLRRRGRAGRRRRNSSSWPPSVSGTRARRGRPRRGPGPDRRRRRARGGGSSRCAPRRRAACGRSRATAMIRVATDAAPQSAGAQSPGQLRVEPQPPQCPMTPRRSIRPPQIGQGADPAAWRPSQAPATTSPSVGLPPPAPTTPAGAGRGRSSREARFPTRGMDRASSSSRRLCGAPGVRDAARRRTPPRGARRATTAARLTRPSGTRR